MKLRSIRTAKRDFEHYNDIIDHRLQDEIHQLVRKFRHKKILHLNATESGGGVAQILHSLVPLAKDLGIEARWKVLEAPHEFFVVTKKIHNSLQGAAEKLTAKDWKLYEEVNQSIAASLRPERWDYIFMHDPQPAAAINYLDKKSAKWIWRCHIDLSKPYGPTQTRFLPYLKPYDGSIFTLKKYVFKKFNSPKVGIIPVAIDPLSATNELMSQGRAKEIIAGFGVKPACPLVVQISRFDPWKDPIGVIAAWRLAKKKIPELQLVLMGDASADDPEGKSVLERVLKESVKDHGIFVITDSNGLAVNAFQTAANVVLQKSIREGFGLTVAEALWSKTPVIGGNVGGIPTQIKNGKDGYLVSNPRDAAKRIVQLIEKPLKAQRMGQWGHEYVRRNFLLPHMLKDELKFLQKLGG